MEFQGEERTGQKQTNKQGLFEELMAKNSSKLTKDYYGNGNILIFDLGADYMSAYNFVRMC